MLNPVTAARPAKPTNTTALYPDTWCEMAAIHQGNPCPAAKYWSTLLDFRLAIIPIQVINTA